MTHGTAGSTGPAGLVGRRWLASVVLAVSAALVGSVLPMGLVVVTAGEARAASSAEVYRVPGSGTFKISGLGFGHGIGMSQFGAEGMGQLGKSYRQIMSFYFPGTDFAQTSAKRQITVGLSGVVRSSSSGTAVTLIDRPGLSASNRGADLDLPKQAGGAAVTSYRVSRGSNGLQVLAVSDAATDTVARGLTGTITWQTATSVDDSRIAVKTAAGGKRLYRGFLEVRKTPSSLLAISRLRLEDYLRSVVSHEVPSSWTAAALRAQAVAARSYALTSQATARATDRPYDICDTTYCQAYGSVAGESKAESRAVRATKGVYLTSAGQPVLAMFSSANGGYSVAGGRPYLVAQRDPYDGVVTGTANWGHQWETRVHATTIENAWPQIGRLEKVKVLGRDGNGQWGGRVLSVGLVGSRSTVSVSADSFRWAAGLKSTWWTVTNSGGGIEAAARNVRVERADLSGVVRWAAPNTDQTVKGYRVTVSPTDEVYRVAADARKVRLTELTNGKEYRAKVAPIYRSGAGPTTATPAFVPSSPLSYFRPLSPQRVLDRQDLAAVDRGGDVAMTVLGPGRAPTTGTRAVVLRVVAASSTGAGRVSVWPCGDERSSQVAATYGGSGTTSGLVTVPVGSRGRVCVGGNTPLTSLRADLLGYHSASGVGSKKLRSVAARRVVNSETGKGWTGGRLVAGEARSVQISGREGVPARARSVVLTLGLVDPTEDATLSIAAPGSPVSSGVVVRAPAGQWRTGSIVARLDSGGRLPLRLTAGRADVQVDVMGWFVPHGGEAAGRYRATPPVTVLGADAPVADGQQRTVQVRGTGSVPKQASAVLVQVLARSDGNGSVTVMPAGSMQDPRPALAFGAHRTQRTLLVVPVGDAGSVTVSSHGADAAVSMRVVGWVS